jgi:hypothetical protein
MVFHMKGIKEEIVITFPSEQEVAGAPLTSISPIVASTVFFNIESDWYSIDSLRSVTFLAGDGRPRPIIAAGQAKQDALETFTGSLVRQFPQLAGITEEDIEQAFEEERHPSD